MANDIIKTRLIEIADTINEKLDTHNYKCQSINISMNVWGAKVTIGVFNEHELMNISFSVDCIHCDDKPSPTSYCEEII